MHKRSEQTVLVARGLRCGLAFAGAVVVRGFGADIFFLLGIFLDRRPPVIAAIVVLGIGLVLRFLSRKPPAEVHPSWYDDEDQDSHRDTEAQR